MYKRQIWTHDGEGFINYTEYDASTGAVSKSIRDVDTTVPVSYTHLRAHETVLDLVCRLLLEKKKKKQPYTHSETFMRKLILNKYFEHIPTRHTHIT